MVEIWISPLQKSVDTETIEALITGRLDIVTKDVVTVNEVEVEISKDQI